MPRKPAPAADRAAPARAFVLPDRTDAAPRQSAASETWRRDRKPDEAEGPRAKKDKDNVQPGQGAEHRSERANEVAKGAGLSRPHAENPDGSDAASAQDAAGASPSDVTADGETDATKAGALPSPGAEILGDNKEPAVSPAAAEANPAWQGEAQPIAHTQPADPVLAIQLANATPALQPEADEPESKAAPESATDEQAAQPGVTVITAPAAAEQVAFAVAVPLAQGAAADPATAAAEGVGRTAAAIGHAAAQNTLTAQQSVTESVVTAEASAEAQDKSTATAPQGPANAQASEQAARAQDAQGQARAEVPPAQPVIATGQPLPRAGEHHHRPEQGQAPQLPQPPESRPTPIQGVPLEVGFRSLEGHKRFDIRLDPGDLGRVEVRLELGDEGSVKATLTVERPETLQMMQRETRALERALEQAGFRPSDGSIDLRLSDRAPDRQQGGDREQSRHQAAKPDSAGETESVRLLHPAQLSRHVAAAMGGVDLVI